MSIDYGNDGSVVYEYDQKCRLTKQTYDGGDTVTYTYDNSGALAKVYDSATGITATNYWHSGMVVLGTRGWFSCPLPNRRNRP